MNPGRAKVEAEGACRACGDENVEHLDTAHLMPRSLVPGQGFDDPDLVIPLCARIKGGVGCHDDFDAHRLDVLAHLTVAEQVAAVRVAGGIENARRNLAPSDYRGEIVAARGLAALDLRPARPSPGQTTVDDFLRGATFE